MYTCRAYSLVLKCISVIPTLFLNCLQSCTANTYRKSKFGGKWAFSCDLTALVCGLVSFVLLVLPFVVVFSMAGSGMFALGSLFKDHIKNLTVTVINDYIPDEEEQM